MRQRVFAAMALVPILLAVSACALFRDNTPEPFGLTPVRVIPAHYHGYWRAEPSDCTLENSAGSQTTLIAAQAMGRPDMLFSVTSIKIGVNQLEVTTQEAGAVQVREIGPGRAQFIHSDGSIVTAVRCPKGSLK